MWQNAKQSKSSTYHKPDVATHTWMQVQVCKLELLPMAEGSFEIAQLG